MFKYEFTMNSKLSIRFVLTFLLFFYANASPVENQEKITKFEELADMNKIQKNGEEKQISTKTLFLSIRDGDEIDTPILLNNVPNLKYDVELLESNDLKKDTYGVEERFSGAALNLDTNIFTDEDIEVHKLNDSRPVSYIALMSIFTIFGLIVLIIYAALMTWRHKLEQRYGHRVLLVSNSDDYNDMHQVNNGDSNSPQYALTTAPSSQM